MEIIKCKKVFKQHSWKKDEYGNVDEYAWEYDIHGGVSCINCYTTICTSCEDYTQCDTECSVSWDECPYCHKRIIPHMETRFCEYCGGKIEYNKDSERVLIKE